MTEIRFYHLQNQSLEQALPALLQKGLHAGYKIAVRTADSAQTRRLDDMLWTYHPNHFLPHGSGKDDNAALQPVWLGEDEVRPNDAEMLVLCSGAEEIPDGVKLCCDIFDGRDESATKAARERWKKWKDAGHDMTYWQQGERGWEKKA